MVLEQTQQNALYNKIVGHLLNLKPEELIIDFQRNHCPIEIGIETECFGVCGCANCWNTAAENALAK